MRIRPAAPTFAATVLGLVVAAPPLSAQTSVHPSAAATGVIAPGHKEPRPRVEAVRASAPVTLDGKLDEAEWATAPVAGDFLQYDPNEGQPATQRTEVRFLIDDDALYIGARMFDTKGKAGVHGRLVRRDQQTDGDYLMFVFDTYHDHAGRTILQVNPAGSRTDAGQAAPNADPSWDPVWDVDTSVDSLGWTAEMRIPWAQLRFP